MLYIPPADLRHLIRQYEELLLQQDSADGPQVRSELADVSRALCESTGTQDLHTALATALDRITRGDR